MHIDPAATAMEQARATKNPLRKLYFWTLHWADTRYALPALVILSFAESSFFPIPPDILLMAMCFARPPKWVLYSTWCTIASVAGGVFGWFLGWGFWEITKNFFFSVVPGFTPEVFGKVQHLYADNAFLGILTAAFTPIPYKVFTVAAGVFAISIPTLILASIIGRGGRFFLVGAIIRFFGPKAKPFLEKNLSWPPFCCSSCSSPALLRSSFSSTERSTHGSSTAKNFNANHGMAGTNKKTTSIAETTFRTFTASLALLEYHNTALKCGRS